MSSESLCTIQGALGDFGSGSAQTKFLSVLKTSSRLPSCFRSAKAGASFETFAWISERVHFASTFVLSASGLRYQYASWPGKPTVTRSVHPSPSTSYGQTKNASE